MGLRLTQETLIPLGMGGAILVAACTLCYQAAALKTTFESKIAAMDERIRDGQASLQAQIVGVQASFHEAATQTVETRDMKLWIMYLRDKNKALDIPEWMK